VSPHYTEAILLEHAGESFLRAVTKSVFLSHEAATRLAYSEFADTEADNVVGFLRRGKLEGLLRDAAELAGLDAEVVRSDSPWNHVEIHAGPVVLTESAVSAPCERVVKAAFRMGLAEGMPRLPGFDDDDRPDEERSLYALILHSRSHWENGDDRQRYRGLPGSAYLAFPSRDLDYYVHVINLFDRYPDIVAAHTPQEWDTEAQVRYLGRARRFGVA
jgi:hypothetical protein